MTLEDLEGFEELQLDEEELEEVQRRIGASVNFPMATLSNTTIYFNSQAARIVPKQIKWFTTHEYVIGLPAADDDKDKYKTRNLGYATAAFFPVGIRKMKKVKEGYYKVYKYKNGFAFKRYEQYNWKGKDNG